MKKNILTFFIMMLCLANIVLTAILMFAMLPSFQKTNRLITQVSEILDLELAKQEESQDPAESINIEDLELIKLTFENKQTLNLTTEEGQDPAYVLLDYITVSLNKKAKDFNNIKKLISENDAYAKDVVTNIISSYNKSSLNKKEICDRAVQEINELYKTECVAKVTLEGFTSN